MRKQIVLSLILFCVGAILPLSAQHNFEVSKNLEIFNSIYKNLDLYYVDTLKAEKQIGNAINYLLDGLDPYTEYYPEKETKSLETLSTGKYAGIGALISYNKKTDRCIISEPYEFMPAAKAGVMAGDIIMSIDGKDVLPRGKMPANEYTSSISDRLRGNPNTEITLVVERQKEQKVFKFQREIIQIPAVSYDGMVSDSVGIIVLGSFTKNCSQEVRQSMRKLKEKGAKSIILDLRDNGGGLAIEAVEIVNLFVPKGKLILQMKGKTKSANSSYSTQREPEDVKMPLIVLVNGHSASASEIVCGALQDLDRAVVMGERTFGKGLVQQPRELPYGGVLKLTTSHYYIPSGRCIQALDYSHRGQNGEAYSIPDSLTHVFHTAHGREVRDGGGIVPDVIAKADSLPNLLAYLRVSEPFFDYITQYRHAHSQILPPAEFSISDADYEAFKQALTKSDFTYDRQTYRAFQDLKKIARFEGYDKTASAEIEALEKKLQHNLSNDLDIWKPSVIKLLNEEICLRYYYRRGMTEYVLQNDSVLRQAVQLFSDQEKYRKILKPGSK